MGMEVFGAEFKGYSYESFKQLSFFKIRSFLKLGPKV